VVRPQQLNEAQIAELFDPPTEQRDLVRHFTLSEADLGAIRRRRGDHNRLGYALMLCYLRHPGRALRSGERPPPTLLAFVAEQIGVLPDAVDEYLAAERNRQRHAVECQEQLRLRPFGKRAAAELESALLPQAIEDDRLARLAELAMETCRQSRIVVPSPAALERLCAKLRHQARGEVYRRLTDGLTAEQTIEIHLDRDRRHVGLLQVLQRLFRDQPFLEGAVLPAADDPYVAGAQPVAQLRQHAEFVMTTVDGAAG
jgi:hypothetical protein